eukprot:RCo031219
MVTFTKALATVPMNRPKRRKWWRGSRERTLPEAQISQELYPVNKAMHRPPIREPKVAPSKKKQARTPEQRAADRARRRAVRRRFSSTRPKFVAVAPAPSEELKQKEEPGVSMKALIQKRILWVSVPVHKIPEKFLNVDCTPTHFHMDTRGWTTNLEIHREYIDGIRVNPLRARAEVRHGMLRVGLPMTYIPETARAKQKKISASVRKARRIRFVQGRGGELLGIRYAAEKRSAAAGKRGKGSRQAVAPTPLQPQIDSVVRDTTPMAAPRRRKRFLGDGEKAIQIVDKVSAEQEQKIAAKQKQTSALARFVQAHQEEKALKYNRARTARDTAFQDLRDAKRRELEGTEEEAALSVPVPLAAGQTAADRPRRKVSFAATPEVAVYGGGDLQAAKKRKRKEQITLQYE